MNLFEIEWRNNRKLMKNPLAIKCITTIYFGTDNVITSRMCVFRFDICVLTLILGRMCHIDRKKTRFMTTTIVID